MTKKAAGRQTKLADFVNACLLEFFLYTLARFRYPESFKTVDCAQNERRVIIRRKQSLCWRPSSFWDCNCKRPGYSRGIQRREWTGNSAVFPWCHCFTMEGWVQVDSWWVASDRSCFVRAGKRGCTWSSIGCCNALNFEFDNGDGWRHWSTYRNPLAHDIAFNFQVSFQTITMLLKLQRKTWYELCYQYVWIWPITVPSVLEIPLS